LHRRLVGPGLDVSVEEEDMIMMMIIMMIIIIILVKLLVFLRLPAD
jgi:hypothetical protein